MAGLSDVVSAVFPTGTVTTDSDGVFRYTLSDTDIAKIRAAIGGALADSTGKPLFRVSGIDQAVIPPLLSAYGLYLVGGIAGLWYLGYRSGRRARR